MKHSKQVKSKTAMMLALVLVVGGLAAVAGSFLRQMPSGKGHMEGSAERMKTANQTAASKYPVLPELTDTTERLPEQTGDNLKAGTDGWENVRLEAGPAPDERENSSAGLSVHEALRQSGHAYVLVQGPAGLWRSADTTLGVLFEIEACNSVLLATEYVELDTGDMIRGWLMTEEYEVLCGYVLAEVLADCALTDKQAEALAQQLWAWQVETEAGARIVFVIEGKRVQEDTPADESLVEVIVSDRWNRFLSEYADDSAEAGWLPGHWPGGD